MRIYFGYPTGKEGEVCERSERMERSERSSRMDSSLHSCDSGIQIYSFLAASMNILSTESLVNADGIIFLYRLYI